MVYKQLKSVGRKIALGIEGTLRHYFAKDQ